MPTPFVLCLSSVCWLIIGVITPAAAQNAITGSVVDEETGEPIPARLYLESDTGEFLHATSLGGIAVPYQRIRGTSREVHTSLSAHPFQFDLPDGNYTVTVERGKEYLPTTRKLSVAEGDPDLQLSLKRWINMAERGWYSGEVHVHRSLSELPTLMLCEDLNVAFPLTAWVRGAEDTPFRNNLNPELVKERELIKIDDTHVIWPINTEYEITVVKGQRHPLGALFMLNHNKPLDLSAPPVSPAVEEARRQGAILDLDKHNWPWSMMLPAVARVDLFELTNNHIWRSAFAFPDFFPDYVPDYMPIEFLDGKITERGWIEFGFQNYYTLLNCGFRLMPSAGTASGVHPVPLGFGRVYVKLGETFSYDAWLEGLKAGRTFVTTGPMLEATFHEQHPGSTINFNDLNSGSLQVEALVSSPDPIERIEIIKDGELILSEIPIEQAKGPTYKRQFSQTVPVDASSWIALRCFTKGLEGRPRFAHTAPVFVEHPDRPLRPRKVEVEYLIQRVEDEIARHEGVLSEKAVAEFNAAADTYRALLPSAR